MAETTPTIRVFEPEGVAGGDQATDTAALADRHVDGVEIGCGAEELQAVGGDAKNQPRVEGADHVQAALRRQGLRVLVGLLEVGAIFDQLGAERRHRRVFLRVVAAGNDDHRFQADPTGGKGDALAVVAAGGADHPGHVRLLATQRVHVDEAAADLERTDRRMVLVLDPHLAAGAAAQQRPTDLRRRRQMSVDHRRRVLEIGKARSGAVSGCPTVHVRPTAETERRCGRD